MMNPIEHAERLQAEAEELPYCPTKTSLLEEAVQYADAAQDIQLAYKLRMEFMSAANFSGRPDIMLVAFSWCLAQYDRDPETYDSYDLLWRYKWVVSDCLKFPTISRSRLQELLIDLERRFRESGSTLHPVCMLQREFFVQIGDREGAQHAHDQICEQRRDRLSDCKACVVSSNCIYYSFLREWEQAVKAANPVLSKALSCAEEPHITFGTVLLPLLQLGRYEEAKDYHLQGMRLVSGASHFVRQHAQHLECATLLGEMSKAKHLVERHMPHALDSILPYSRFRYFLAARLWTDRLLQRGTKKLKARLPNEIPALDAKGNYDVSALGEWFRAQAETIARQFDARNGTDIFQRQIDELPERLQLAID